MNIVSLRCPDCGAPIEKRGKFCMHCGAKLAVDDIQFYQEDAKTERQQNYLDAAQKIYEEDIAHCEQQIRSMQLVAKILFGLNLAAVLALIILGLV